MAELRSIKPIERLRSLDADPDFYNSKEELRHMHPYADMIELAEGEIKVVFGSYTITYH